ncbi:hypothetical protein V8E54_004086 [Elaphomyces granulatus]|jgi:hypothetical protein
MSTTENPDLPVAVDGPTWAKYEKEWVLRALWNPEAYRTYREKYMDLLRRVLDINNGRAPHIVGAFEQRIEWLEDCTPRGPAIPNSEPLGLDLKVYYRIEELKNMCHTSSTLTLDDRNNINAVLEAYRSGTLKVQLGHASYWYNGILKRDLSRYAVDLDEALPRWRVEHGQGKCWVERIWEPVFPSSPQFGYT